MNSLFYKRFFLWSEVSYSNPLFFYDCLSYYICICLYVLSSVLSCSVRLYPQLFVEGLMSYLWYLSTFAYYVFKHILNIRVTWQVSYKRQELLSLPQHMSSPPDFGGVRVAHLFSFLRCVSFIFVMCLVSSVGIVSGLSILDCRFGFL